MRWKLSSAVLRCSARRARAAVAAGPFVAALAALVVASLPLFALLAGREFAPFVTAASTDPVLANALAVIVVAPALALGLAVGALMPGDRMLGPQLAPAPVTPIARFALLTLAPLAAVVVPLSVTALIGGVAASSGAPAGRWLGVSFVAAFLAAAALGAALATALTAAAAGGLRLLPLPIAAGAAWPAIGAAAGEPLLGVGAWVAHAAAGGVGEALVAVLVCALVLSLAIAIWALSSEAAADARAGRRDVRLVVGLAGDVRAAFGVAVALRLFRHRQIRRHALIAVLFAFGGALLLRAVGAGETAASYLPFAAALVASAAMPPAAAALSRDAEWLLRTCPTSGGALARSAATASVAAAAATIALVLAVAAPVAVLDPGVWPLAETSAAVIVAAAVAGGALVPWRPDRVVEQTASYVVVAALAAFGSYALSRGAAEAAAIGVPEAVFAGFTANAAVLGAIFFAGAVGR